MREIKGTSTSITFYDVKQTVSDVISEIHPDNQRQFCYFDAMAVTFDLPKKLRKKFSGVNISFPENAFDKYRNARSLSRYVYNELINHK